MDVCACACAWVCVGVRVRVCVCVSAYAYAYVYARSCVRGRKRLGRRVYALCALRGPFELLFALVYCFYFFGFRVMGRFLENQGCPSGEVFI